MADEDEPKKTEDTQEETQKDTQADTGGEKEEKKDESSSPISIQTWIIMAAIVVVFAVALPRWGYCWALWATWRPS